MRSPYQRAFDKIGASEQAKRDTINKLLYTHPAAHKAVPAPKSTPKKAFWTMQGIAAVAAAVFIILVLTIALPIILTDRDGDPTFDTTPFAVVSIDVNPSVETDYK